MSRLRNLQDKYQGTFAMEVRECRGMHCDRSYRLDKLPPPLSAHIQRINDRL